MIFKLTIFHHKGAFEINFVLCALSGKHATNQFLVLKLFDADFFSLYVDNDYSVFVCVDICISCE